MMMMISGKRYGHSYCGTSTKTRMVFLFGVGVEWCNLQLHRVAHNRFQGHNIVQRHISRKRYEISYTCNGRVIGNPKLLSSEW